VLTSVWAGPAVLFRPMMLVEEVQMPVALEVTLANGART
jgi:hypothetical protein